VVTAGSEHVAAAATVVVDALQPLVDRDWSARAGDLEWSCAHTAAHIAHDLTKYSAQLAGRVDETYLRFKVVVAPDESPAEHLRILRSAAQLLVAIVEVVSDDARAWHYGLTDRSGFAAMGIGEMFVHTYDITSGLDVDWRPPAHLAELALAIAYGRENGTFRPLIPDRSPYDASAALLWATGRIELDGRPPVRDWVWHPAMSMPTSGRT
jgi:uncharacterized protein (TIGR03083 family)